VRHEGFLAQVFDGRVFEVHVLQLLLDRRFLLLPHVDELDRHLLLLQALQHALLLARCQEQDSTSFAVVSGGTADTVDVGIDIVRAVNLDNEIDGGEI